jgi:hypothetical protein
VLQGFPQDFEHLAKALYYWSTPCPNVLQPTVQSNSFGRKMQLEFVDASSLLAQGLAYQVCPNVTWPQSNGRKGPVDTFLWFHNPCKLDNVSISANVTRLNQGVASFCRLRLQSHDGTVVIRCIGCNACGNLHTQKIVVTRTPLCRCPTVSCTH